MRVYIYMSHCGDLYVSDEYYDSDKLYCEECGDSDELLLVAESLEEAKDFLADKALLNRRAYTPERCEKALKDCEELFDEESKRK